MSRTNDALHLRKFARLLLDTHDGDVVVQVLCASIDRAARTFWWSIIPRLSNFDSEKSGKKAPMLVKEGTVLKQ